MARRVWGQSWHLSSNLCWTDLNENWKQIMSTKSDKKCSRNLKTRPPFWCVSVSNWTESDKVKTNKHNTSDTKWSSVQTAMVNIKISAPRLHLIDKRTYLWYWSRYHVAKFWVDTIGFEAQNLKSYITAASHTQNKYRCWCHGFYSDCIWENESEIQNCVTQLKL